MIQKFRVKNCLSIRDEQVLDFVATSDDTSEDLMIVTKNNVRLSKLGLVYGANASGKSNILFALAALVRFMGSLYDPETTSAIPTPFLLDSESRLQPTEMGLTFYIDETRYEYSLTIQDSVVLNEELFRFPMGRASLVFRRMWNKETESSDIVFGSTLKLTAKQKYTLTGITRPNASVIGTYIRNNIDRIDVFEELRNYFRSRMLPLLTRSTDIEKFSNRLVKIIPKLKDFILKVLSLADFNISDFIIEEEKTEIPEDLWNEIQHISDYLDEMPQRTYTEEKLFFEHKSFDYSQQLPKGAESVGTNRMYGLATYLFLLTNLKSVMLADEIESSLHYDLLRYLISLFLLNSKESQIICTTHSLLLLDEPFIRRDSIHICRKDSAGATEVVRASEFGLRKGVSILNAYREGKLGGVPNLGGLIL